MERRNITEAETKLVLLYALDRLGPVTNQQLLQFLAELDLMDYFTMQLNLAELTEQGQVTPVEHPLGTLLCIAPAGAYALEVFTQRIPASRRTVIDEHAPVYRESFRLDQQTPAQSSVPVGSGIGIRLCLMEGDSMLLDLLMRLQDADTPVFLQKRWRMAAQGVYEAINLLLSQGFDAAAPAPELPSTAAFQQDEHGDWLLSLADTPDDPAFTLLLSLPDEHLARHYAAAWPAHSAALRGLILERLNAAEVTKKP